MFSFTYTYSIRLLWIRHRRKLKNRYKSQTPNHVECLTNWCTMLAESCFSNMSWAKDQEVKSPPRLKSRFTKIRIR